MSTDIFKCPNCGSKECWFDRTITYHTDERGTSIEDGMHTRCSDCGKPFEELFPIKCISCNKDYTENDSGAFDTDGRYLCGRCCNLLQEGILDDEK